ncbi:MAG: hypothetical protein LBU06_09530 [Desulfovibrio sp.]|nr:hypothetical protein [Desulfovibrio sp.]
MTLPDALYLPFAEHYELIGPLLAKSLFGWENAQALSRVEALAKRTGRDSVSRALPGKGKSDAVAKHRLEDVDREKLDAFAAEKKVGRQRNWNPVVYPQEVED